MTKRLSLLLLLAVQILVAQVPDYYATIDFTQSGTALKNDLNALISIQTAYPYSSSSTDTWDILQDCDLYSGTDVLLVYGYDDTDGDPANDRLRDFSLICDFSGSCVGYWNREHVFPKSLATPALVTDSAGSGTDLHNLRAADSQMNSTRNNHLYEAGSGNAGLTLNGFYPGDEYKGDVARIIMYMYTRYPSQCIATNVGYGPTTYNSNMPDIFLEWNAADPVSAFEISRNETIFGYQGNRNPFVDNPYLATLIWGGPIAEDTWGTTTDTRVQFASTSATVNEGDGFTTLTVQILNAAAGQATTADVVLVSGDAADIDNYSTQTVTFPAGDSSPQTVTITITDDALLEGNETLGLSLQNVQGGSNAAAGTLSSFSLTIQDNEGLSDLVINEVLADPDVTLGDANGDGVINTSQDEFIELFNPNDVAMDLTGYTLNDGYGLRHAFPDGTWIPAHKALVVFGGGTPTNIPGPAQVASTGLLGLNNGGDTLTIYDALGNTVTSFTYGAEGGNNQSLARTPDLTGDFVAHTTITTNPVNQSPGYYNTTPQAITPQYTWDGSSSTAWNDSSNWSSGQVPSADAEVTIPTGTPFAPTIGAQDGVTLYGLTTNDALTIASDGSLIVRGTASGLVTYERSLATTDWYLVAAPVAGQSIDAFASTEDLMAGSGNNLALAPYNNGSGLWDYYQNGSSNSGLLNSGQGYSLALNAANTIHFTGTLNTQALSFPISTGSSNAYNLVGNPYTAYLPANSAADAQNLLDTNAAVLSELTLWLWNGSTNQYDVVNQLTDAQYLAPGQGFFVSSSAAGGGFSFPASQQAHQSSSWFQRQTPMYEHVVLQMHTATQNYHTDVYYLDTATVGFDNGYDSSVFEADAASVSLYTAPIDNTDTHRWAIQALPDSALQSMAVPVGVVADGGTSLHFEATAQNLPAGLQVVLEDTATQTWTVLEPGSGYDVSLSNAEQGTGRFYLHVQAESLDVAQDQLVHPYAYVVSPQHLQVDGLTSPGQLAVYSLLGQAISQHSLQQQTGAHRVVLPPLDAGIYLIRITTANGSYTQKLYIP